MKRGKTIHLKGFVVVQLLSHVQLFGPHRLQHARPPCPSRSSRVCPSSCPLNQRCYPTILGWWFWCFLSLKKKVAKKLVFMTQYLGSQCDFFPVSKSVEIESVSRSVMSDSFQPHGLQPTRLLCPRDFPGENTGVDCHFLLQGIWPFPHPGIEARSPALQADSLQSEPPENWWLFKNYWKILF